MTLQHILANVTHRAIEENENENGNAMNPFFVDYYNVSGQSESLSITETLCADSNDTLHLLSNVVTGDATKDIMDMIYEQFGDEATSAPTDIVICIPNQLSLSQRFLEMHFVFDSFEIVLSAESLTTSTRVLANLRGH